MSHPADGPPPGWLVEVPFAHRGLHLGAPENSLSAVAEAVGAGIGVEVDARITADGVAVVLHDRTLSRMTGVDGAIDAVRFADLRDLRLGDTDETIPSLAAVLDVVDGQVPVMVEVKNPRAGTGRIEPAVVDALDVYHGPVCVASFNPLTVAWFRRHVPAVVRGQTAGPLTAAPMPAVIRASLRELWWNLLTRPHFVSYDLAGLPSRATDRWREKGRVLVAWTATTAAEARAARQLADNVILEGSAALAEWSGQAPAT